MENRPLLLYRIGRLSDPLDFPPIQFCGNGRFDDPLLAEGHLGPWYRVLYLGETRLTCFLEILQGFRPDFAYLARIATFPDGDDDPDLPTDETIFSAARMVSGSWLGKKAVQPITVDSLDGWMDVRALSLRESLRFELAEDLLELGMTDFDLSAITSTNRPMTQRVARYLYENDAKAIWYTSRFGCEFNCVALFEGTSFAAFEPAQQITHGDADLVAAMQAFDLTPDFA